MSQFFTLPIRKEAVAKTVYAFAAGAGMIVGGALRQLGILFGILLLFLGIFYLYADYKKEGRNRRNASVS
jgi:hypothetical protein